PPGVTPSVGASGPTGFVMTLQQTDVSRGQRSPEIFIPLKARNVTPEFWGWPDQFNETATTYNRAGVRIRHGSEIVNATMMGWKRKSDLRLRSAAIRSAGAIGDIIRIERVNPSTGYHYLVDIIPPEHTQYPVLSALCTRAVGGNSKKTFGYY